MGARTSADAAGAIHHWGRLAGAKDQHGVRHAAGRARHRRLQQHLRRRERAATGTAGGGSASQRWSREAWSSEQLLPACVTPIGSGLARRGRGSGGGIAPCLACGQYVPAPLDRGYRSPRPTGAHRERGPGQSASSRALMQPVSRALWAGAELADRGSDRDSHKVTPDDVDDVLLLVRRAGPHGGRDPGAGRCAGEAEQPRTVPVCPLAA